MITPSDSPSSPSDYAAVTPHGQGTAPYDVQAAQGDLSAVTAAAVALAAPGGPRQAETATLMQSPQGFGSAGYDIDAGYHAAPGNDGWPNNIEPGG